MEFISQLIPTNGCDPTLATLGAKHLEGVDRKPERHWVLRVVGPGRRAGLGDGQLQFS